MRIAVCGAGGAIGGHLVGSLLNDGHEVVALDKKYTDDWYQLFPEAENYHADLTDRRNCETAFARCDQVYGLAADMGGMGFLNYHRIETWHSVDITSSMLAAAHNNGCRFFYSSSACVYPDYAQQATDSPALKEDDAWPADPEPCYGMEKLYGEEGCKWYAIEQGMTTRVARYHNVYSTHGTYDGGREKLPAAATRKIIAAKVFGTNEVEIWGDGEQTRSYMWIDDCIHGTKMIMNGDYDKPLNLGSSELVSVNQVFDILEEIAGIKVKRNYNLSAPQGVRGRNSDNTLIRQVYGWEPSTPLRDGLERLYAWMWDDIA